MRFVVVNYAQHLVVLSYIFVTSLHINCIFVIRHPDDGHKGNRNVFVKNNLRLGIFINVYLLISTFVPCILILSKLINALPDDGVTVTPKHVEAVLI